MTLVRLRLAASHHVAPFVGFCVFAFAATGLESSDTDWALVGIGLVFALATAAVALRVPWHAVPAGALLALPLACDVVVAVLRQAQGGIASGYAPLAVLPVVWVSLVLPRWSIWVMTGAMALLFALPIVLIGAPFYPHTMWRAVVVLVAVALVVGIVVNRAVVAQRRFASLARRRAEELDRLVETQTAIATAFDVDAVLETVAEEALRLTAADGAVVELPDGEDLVYRSTAGAAKPHVGLRLRMDATLSGRALRTGEVLVCDDTEVDEGVDREACRRIGARSMILVPLPHDGAPAGVLKVYAARPAAFDAAAVRVLSALAGMIGTALVRSERMHELGEQAATDELTGAASRRAWYAALGRALERARRTDAWVSVIVLDLDGLKAVNDELGHRAGDRVLVESVAHWGSVLRETDLLGRVGGDEFAVLLEATGDGMAREIADRLERALVGRRASWGVATWDGDEDGATLVARADAAMYRHKLAARRSGPSARAS